MHLHPAAVARRTLQRSCARERCSGEADISEALGYVLRIDLKTLSTLSPFMIVYVFSELCCIILYTVYPFANCLHLKSVNC